MNQIGANWKIKEEKRKKNSFILRTAFSYVAFVRQIFSFQCSPFHRDVVLPFFSLTYLKLGRTILLAFPSSEIWFSFPLLHSFFVFFFSFFLIVLWFMCSVYILWMRYEADDFLFHIWFETNRLIFVYSTSKLKYLLPKWRGAPSRICFFVQFFNHKNSRNIQALQLLQSNFSYSVNMLLSLGSVQYSIAAEHNRSWYTNSDDCKASQFCHEIDWT